MFAAWRVTVASPNTCGMRHITLKVCVLGKLRHANYVSFCHIDLCFAVSGNEAVILISILLMLLQAIKQEHVLS